MDVSVAVSWIAIGAVISFAVGLIAGVNLYDRYLRKTGRVFDKEMVAKVKASLSMVNGMLGDENALKAQKAPLSRGVER